MRTFAQIQTATWNHPTFRNRPKILRDLMLYLMSSPHSNYIGFYCLPLPVIADHMQEPAETIRAALDGLCATGWCAYDHAARVVLIRDHLEWNKVNGKQQVTGGLAAAKAAPKSPLLAEWVKCACLHCPDYRDQWESLLSGAPSPVPQPPGVPSPEAQSAVSASREATEPDPGQPPDGYVQLFKCHEQHAPGSAPPEKDREWLKEVLRRAEAVNVPWQTLLTIMQDVQASFKPKPGKARIDSVRYYRPRWDEHIAGAAMEMQQPKRASPHANGAYDEPLDDEDDPLAARVRAQTEALARAAEHGT